jgi:hypothetical protein
MDVGKKLEWEKDTQVLDFSAQSCIIWEKVVENGKDAGCAGVHLLIRNYSTNVLGSVSA